MDTYRVHYTQGDPYGDVSWSFVCVNATSQEEAKYKAYEVILEGYEHQTPGWRLHRLDDVELHYAGEWLKLHPHQMEGIPNEAVA